eukprot:178802_1
MYLSLKRNEISMEKLSTLGCVHNYHPHFPITVSRYSWTGFYLYREKKDYFIDGGGGMIQTVTNGLTALNMIKGRYKLSTFKLAIAAGIRKKRLFYRWWWWYDTNCYKWINGIEYD